MEWQLRVTAINLGSRGEDYLDSILISKLKNVASAIDVSFDNLKWVFYCIFYTKNGS
ncbi:hypothetical protein D3C80_1974120 [compost metagenome]